MQNEFSLEEKIIETDIGCRFFCWNNSVMRSLFAFFVAEWITLVSGAVHLHSFSTSTHLMPASFTMIGKLRCLHVHNSLISLWNDFNRLQNNYCWKIVSEKFENEYQKIEFWLRILIRLFSGSQTFLDHGMVEKPQNFHGTPDK